jgi:hypothetical protein
VLCKKEVIRHWAMKLIFIGGSERSGTTLFQTIVANAIKSPIISEAQFIRGLIELYRRGIKSWYKNSDYFVTKNDFKRYIQSSIDQIIDLLKYKFGEFEYIVLKDPSFAKYYLELIDIFPDSTYFFCIRDPRDIVASYLKIEGKGNDITKRGFFYPKRNIKIYCKKINKRYRGFIAVNSLPIVCRYEDLVNDPVAEISKIEKLSRLPLSYDIEKELEWGNEKRRHAPNWITNLEGNPPSNINIGRYKSVLKNKEIKIVEHKCKDIIQHFNY